jgi:hypothetical protein
MRLFLAGFYLRSTNEAFDHQKHEREPPKPSRVAWWFRPPAASGRLTAVA